MSGEVPIEQIPATAAAQRLNVGPREQIVLLDCREHKELAISRIEGATHIPMGEIPARQGELDPDAEIIVFCHHGVRGNNVALFLRQQGFTNVKNLRGGIDAWSVEVDPRIPRY